MFHYRYQSDEKFIVCLPPLVSSFQGKLDISLKPFIESIYEGTYSGDLAIQSFVKRVSSESTATLVLLLT